MDRKPRVLVAAPSYDGWRQDGNSRALYLEATDGRLEVGVAATGTSLLAYSFNIAFAQALDGHRDGEFDYFAMLHADIEPLARRDSAGRLEAGWLDTLHEELTRAKADVISAVVPIKEPGDDRRTSTAIFRKDAPWEPARYIRMSDRRWLPATFTAKEALCEPGEELCVNTGCMLLDLRRPWWEGFAFSIRDELRRDDAGQLKAYVRPEDWEMSRHVNAAGGVVAATWAVRLLHHGRAAFANH